MSSMKSGPEREDGSMTLMKGTITHEIPFKAGKVEIVSEVRIKMDEGACITDEGWNSYLQKALLALNNLDAPEYTEPEKLSAMFAGWIKKVESLSQQESMREVPNDMKIEALKNIKKQVEYGADLLKQGRTNEAENLLYGAIDAYHLAAELPDDPTLGIMLREMVKAVDFVTPLVRITSVDKLAKAITNKVRGKISEVWEDGLYKGRKADEKEPV